MEKQNEKTSLEKEEDIFPSLEGLELKPIQLIFKDNNEDYILLTSDREVYVLDDIVFGEDTSKMARVFSVRKDKVLLEGVDLYRAHSQDEEWTIIEEPYYLPLEFKPLVFRTNCTIRDVLGQEFVVYNIPPKYDIVLEDFSRPTFSMGNWITENYDGSLCMRNNVIGHGGNTEFTITKPCTIIKFDYYISSENNCDFFRFYIDNNELISVSGIVGWVTFEKELDTGEHSFRFRYHKDSSVNTGRDSVFIRNLEWSVYAPTPEITTDDLELETYYTMYQIEDNSYTLMTSVNPIFIIEDEDKWVWSSDEENRKADYTTYRHLAGVWLKENYDPQIIEEKDFTTLDAVSNYNILTPALEWFNNVGNDGGFLEEISDEIRKRYYISYRDGQQKQWLITSTNPFFMIENEEGDWVFSNSSEATVVDYSVYEIGEQWSGHEGVKTLDGKLYYPHQAIGNIGIITPCGIHFYTQTDPVPLPTMKKFLVYDQGGTYTSNGAEYVKISSRPPTQDNFLYRGVDEIPTHPTNILSHEAKLMFYTEKEELAETKMLSINSVPKMQRIVKKEYFPNEGETKLERIKIYSKEAQSGKIYYALSVDKGENYLVYKDGSWETIDVNNDNLVREKGMTKEVMHSFNASHFEPLTATGINVMVFLDKETVSDTCEISQLHVFYVQEEIEE